MTDDEKAAREKLGAWLATEAGRTWDYDGPSRAIDPVWGCQLSERFGDKGLGWFDAPTLAEAIQAALEKATK